MKFASNSLTEGILKAMAVFSGVQMVNIVCSVVRTKLVALWIGPVGVGLLAIYNNVVDMLSNATQLNLRQSAVRDISKAGASEREHIVGAVKWWGWRLGIFGALVISMLSPAISYFSFGDIDMWWAFCVLSIAMVATAMLNAGQAVMQGCGHLKTLAKSSIWGAVGGTVLAAAVYRYLGAEGIMLSICGIWTAVCISTYIFLDIKGHRNELRENLRIGRSFLKFGAYLTVSGFVTTFASYIFLSYLSRTATVNTTGLYQAGYTLVVQYVGIIFTALSMEYYPRMARVASRKQMASVLMSHEMTLLVSLVIVPVVLFIIADKLLVTILYTEAFYPILFFAEIAICGTIFRAVSFCMSYVILARGEGRVYVVTETLSVSIGLALNIVGYRYWGFTGLGVSYVLWYMIYTVIMGVVCIGRFGMRVSGSVIRVTACAVIIAGAALALRQVAWWAALPMLIPAIVMPLSAIRHKKAKKQSLV